MKDNYFKTAAKISLVLLLICAVIAGVVAFVYSFTIDAYEANIAAQKRVAISSIFAENDGDVIDYTSLESLPEGANEIYAVSKNSQPAGYCVNISGKGFGGEISLMIGYNADGTVKGVNVVSHSETPGVGTNVVGSPDFLAQYENKAGELTISKKAGADVVAVSGATISSKAVNAAVNKANAIVASLIATEGGIEQ